MTRNFTQKALLVLVALTLSVAALAQDADALATQAMDAYYQKDYGKSSQLFLAAIKAGNRDLDVLYNAACSLALAGKTEDAFAHLQQLAQRGYFNADHLKQDTDLNSLHGDARWQSLVQKVTANAQAQKQLWDNPALKTPYKENLSDEEKIAGLSKFWSEAKFNFVNFDLVPELNLDALYLEYLGKIRQTKSTLEYYKLMIEFGAKLKDGHTGVNAPNELTDEMFARPRLQTRLVENKVMIIAVPDEQLRADGLAPGQEIVAIDGVPVKEYAAQKVTPYQSASTKQDLETSVYEYALLRGSAQHPIELTLLDANGNSFKKTVRRLTLAERNKVGRPLPPMEFKMLPGNIAHVMLNTFNDNRAAEMFEAAFDEIAKASALILDVRNNGGGNSGVGYRVLACLTDKPFQTSKWHTRNYRPAFRAWQRPQDTFGSPAGQSQPNGKKLYTKPVLVLSSPRTYSAAEDFLVAFETMRRGLIVGEASGGSTGQPLFFTLPGGGSARICTKRDSFPDGREFVGVGIQPHKPVTPTIADLRAGKDTVLDAALKELQTVLK